MIISGFRALLLALLLAGCGTAAVGNPIAAKHGGEVWRIPITPELGGPSFDIGSWPNRHDCNDMDGSFQNAHPDACHRTGKSSDCGVIGNGQAYSKDVPYPRPQGYPAVAGGCYQVPGEAEMSGWHFLEYHSLPTPGGSAPMCSEFAKYKALADSDPAHYKVATVSKGCGGPCWPARQDNACF